MILQQVPEPAPAPVAGGVTVEQMALMEADRARALAQRQPEPSIRAVSDLILIEPQVVPTPADLPGKAALIRVLRQDAAAQRKARLVRLYIEQCWILY